MQQLMFTDMVILAVCKCTANTFIWLLNTLPLGISYENVSERQLCMFCLGILHFQDISLWRKLSLEIRMNWLLFPFHFLLEKTVRQSFYTCWCVVRSPKVR